MEHWRTHSKSTRIAGGQGLECHEPLLERSAAFVPIRAIRVTASSAFVSIRVHSWLHLSTRPRPHILWTRKASRGILELPSGNYERASFAKVGNKGPRIHQMGRAKPSIHPHRT